MKAFDRINVRLKVIIKNVSLNEKDKGLFCE